MLEWLPRYSLKEDLVGDVVSGLTNAILHIPQGEWGEAGNAYKLYSAGNRKMATVNYAYERDKICKLYAYACNNHVLFKVHV